MLIFQRTQRYRFASFRIITANQPLLNLVVKNPQDYTDRQASKFKKAALKLNYDTSGTIISMTINSLKYDYGELKMLLDKTFTDYKRRTY